MGLDSHKDRPDGTGHNEQECAESKPKPNFKSTSHEVEHLSIGCLEKTRNDGTNPSEFVSVKCAGCGKSKQQEDFYPKGKNKRGETVWDSQCEECIKRKKNRKNKMKRLSKLGIEKRKKNMIDIDITKVFETKTESNLAVDLERLLRNLAFDTVVGD